ncbi:unnamed protein product [Phaedon cochleariae]|uniref:Mitochondrial carrier protein n=1 Tax=Phaedon cochleariae TaxID=80249 RepID=A0A9P0DGP4_PHACE|nr:unnamed protein product [Phaedon cochleariae]
MDEVGLCRYFICGGFGGICSILIGHPFDTIKVRLQTMPLPKTGETTQYKGTLDCFRKTMKQEGVHGLYKGMGAPLLFVAPCFAVSFMTYGLGRQLFESPHWKDKQLHYLPFFLAGAFSGIFTAMLAPCERVKCLLQVQQGLLDKERIYKGPVDCVKKLYRKGGILSVYRGFTITLVRDVPVSGVYFLTYEVMLDFIGPETSSYFRTILAGGCAGLSICLVGVPPDVLKSRLQAAPDETYKNGMREVFSRLMRSEGILALYKGLSPVLMRAFPANAACFLGFEKCKQFLDYALGQDNVCR